MTLRKRILITLVPLVLIGSIWGGVAYAQAHRPAELCSVQVVPGWPGSWQTLPPGIHAPHEHCYPANAD